jgi:hypothetical protein
MAWRVVSQRNEAKIKPADYEVKVAELKSMRLPAVEVAA